MAFEITKSCNLLCVCYYPSCVEVIFVLTLVPYLLCRGGCCWREKLCSPCVLLPKSSVEVPCVGSPLWTH